MEGENALTRRDLIGLLAAVPLVGAWPLPEQAAAVSPSRPLDSTSLWCLIEERFDTQVAKLGLHADPAQRHRVVFDTYCAIRDKTREYRQVIEEHRGAVGEVLESEVRAVREGIVDKVLSLLDEFLAFAKKSEEAGVSDWA